MLLIVQKSLAQIKLNQLKLAAQALLDTPITSSEVYSQIKRDHRNWQQLCESLLKSIFSEHTEFYNKIFTPPSCTSSTNGWKIEANLLVEQIKDQLSAIESLIQQLSYIDCTDELQPNKIVSENQMIEVFISHSSKDEEITKKLVNCIELSLQVPNNSIRCTSVGGYQPLPGNKNTSEVLRQNIESSKIVICLLTPSSQQSGYVLVELGAAWGLKKPLCILSAGGAKYSDAPGPLTEFDILKAENPSDITRLIRAVSDHTGYACRPLDNVVSTCTDFSRFVTSLNRD
jgi:TIR domain